MIGIVSWQVDSSLQQIEVTQHTKKKGCGEVLSRLYRKSQEKDFTHKRQFSFTFRLMTITEWWMVEVISDKKNDAYFRQVWRKCCKHLRSINNNFGLFHPSNYLQHYKLTKLFFFQAKKVMRIFENHKIFNAHSYHCFLAHK